MFRRRLFGQLFLSTLIVVGGVMLVFFGFAARQFSRVYMEQMRRELLAQARLIEMQARPFFIGDRTDAEAFCERVFHETGVRVTLFRRDGELLADSERGAEAAESNRPEVQEALAGRLGFAVRSQEEGRRLTLAYAAVPVREEENVVGVVRSAFPLMTTSAALRKFWSQISLGAVLLLLLAAAVSYVVSGRISQPIEDLRLAAGRLASGQPQPRIFASGPEEIAALADHLNHLSAQLDEKIRMLQEERSREAAMLSSMAEGILAVDRSERILEMNAVAGRLLNIAPQEARGRYVQEVVRPADLQKFIARTLASEAPTEGDLLLTESGETFLQLHGTRLRNAVGEPVGALIVLTDVTRLRRLERVRRDFVANVSHELKTPITSIRGFAETLRDGALENPEDARRFVEIILRQAERLGAIIEDLLTLSRLEQEAEQRQLTLVDHSVQSVIAEAVQLCAPRAQARDIRLEIICDPALRARCNPPLLEQAVVNLLDNAIKFSEPNSTVWIEARRTGEGVDISVRDTGCGIPAEHLPRLFERFYRVDKARSRQLGGTGLGLAIVKHIMQAHGGRVSVESTPGRGSVFTLHLPGVSGSPVETS